MDTKSQLTIKQLQTAFGVAHMTIHNWRKGSTLKAPLPFKIDDPTATRPRVFFEVEATKKWAETNGVQFAVDLEKVLADSTLSEPVKPGPKPKPKPPKH